MTSDVFSIVYKAGSEMMTSNQDSRSQIMCKMINLQHIYCRATFEVSSLSSLRNINSSPLTPPPQKKKN